MCSTTGICQSRIEVGVRGGVPFNDAFQSQLSSGTRTITSDRSRYTVGPTIRTTLTEHLAVQLDALYTHSRYDRVDTPGCVCNVLTSSVHYDRWDFPLLALLESSRPSRAFIGGGIALHRSNNTFRTTVFSPNGTVSPFSVRAHGGDGKALAIVISSGLRRKVGPVVLEPEIRYSRLRSDAPDSSGSPFEVIRTPNQFEFMLGITIPRFRSHNKNVK